MVSNNIPKIAITFLILFFLALLFAYSASASTLNNSLSAYWELNNNGLDSQNVFHLAPTGIDWVAGQINNAADLEFGDLTDSLANTTNDFYKVDDFTVAAWVKPETFNDHNQVIISTLDGTGGGSGFMVALRLAGIISIEIWSSGAVCQIFDASAAVGTGFWSHVTATFNDTENIGVIYINGTYAYNETCALSISDPNNGIFVGETPTAGWGQNWDGTLDEVVLWNRSLNSTEVLEAYNSDGWPFEPTGAPAPPIFNNFTINATDVFNNTQISAFNLTLDGVFYESNNITFTTHLLLNNTNLHNISVWVEDAYFNRSYLDYNISVSGNLNALLHQAKVTLNATEKLTNNSLTDVTFYVDSLSGTQFNLSAGNHTITAEKTGYYNLSQNITVLPLTDTSYNITGMFNSLLNVTVVNALDNTSITSFTASISFGEVISTTNGSATFGLLNNTNYTVNISGSGFASSLNNNATVNSSLSFLNVTIFTFNSILFNIINESNLLPLNQLVYIHTISNITTFSNTTNNSFIVLDLLNPDDYEIRFESAGFNPRSIFLTVLNDSTQTVNIYLTENKSTGLQVLEILDTANQPVEGAVVWLQKQLINESDIWITIQEAETDYDGKTSVFVERDVTIFYRFAVIVEGVARPIQPSGNLFTGKTSFIPGVTETIQLIVNLEEEPTDFISEDLAVSFNVTWVNNTINYTFIDGRNTIVGGRLLIEASYINETLDYVTIGNISVLGSSGFINYTITPINNSVWRLTTTLIYETNEVIVWQGERRFEIDVIIDKNSGLLFAALLLCIVLALTVTMGVLPSSLITIGVLIPLSYFKLISVPTTIITSLLALAIILFFRTRKLDE